MPNPGHLPTLQRASFDKIEFAWTELSIGSTLRKHEHEYRHTPGGSVEKHGRRLYTVRFSCFFDEALNARTLPGGVPGFPGNYPKNLSSIRVLFEKSTTAALVIPTLGTIQAVISDYQQRASSSLLSGERVDLTFTEDQEKKFLLDSLIATVANTADLAERVGDMVDNEKANIPATIFAKIQGVIDDVLGIRDEAFALQGIVAGKIEQIAQTIGEVEKTLKLLQDPTKWPLAEAIKDLWATVVSLAETTEDTFSPQLRTYVTPKSMTIQDVSLALYNRTDKSFDLLSLNDVPEPLAIAAGTTMKWLSDA